jgi:hypothetical protein
VFLKEGSGMVTSGKVYEYVATGLPIVSMLAAQHDARRILDGYPRWHDAIEYSARALSAAMLEAIADVADGEHRFGPAAAYGAQRSRKAQLRPALDDVFAALAP